MGSAPPLANTLPSVGGKDHHFLHLFQHKPASAPQLGAVPAGPESAALAFANHTVGGGAASAAAITLPPVPPGSAVTNGAPTTGTTATALAPSSSQQENKARVSSEEERDNEIIQYVTKEKLERFFKYFPDMPATEDLILGTVPTPSFLLFFLFFFFSFLSTQFPFPFP